ncbi:protein zyg-11 homolog [Chanos chanos]|uniref:Protein zyg-11 homolog n=1 Tax=Chanos chanos TaxID=29144 RepID=A0A6J2VDU4_CHACN|nr:protein zyg-11 homolog [Chanos chanos]
MNEENPLSLADICQACICHNLEQLCTRRTDGTLHFHQSPVFPQELSDQLLHKMADEGVLNDSTIGIFRCLEHFRLRRACIQSSCVSPEGFRQTLCLHRLQELDVSRVTGLAVSDVLSSLANSKDCRQGLQRLVLSGLSLLGENAESSQLRFSFLRGLRTLCVAWTELDDAGLEDICTLPSLENLDISGTSISDLTSLLNCQANLRSLTAHGLRNLEMSASRLLSVLSKLEALRHLDLSNDRLVADGDGMVQQLLVQPGVLPALVSLDVSGWRGVSDAAAQAFVESRQGMRFIGLLATGAGASEFFSRTTSVKVAGEANLGQICEALQRYRERECFMREALIHLYSLTSDLDEPQPHVLKLVSMAMQSHPESLHVQLVATACVFNLTTQDLAMGLPLRLLGTVVQQLLTAMRNFPNHEQLQKNCLLALCSDRILQDVPFDRFEAAKLVMTWLSVRENQTLQRMAVAIVSILVSKLTVEETTQLGAEVFIMKQLLSIVQQKASLGVVDPTLKFALSALWNLTDETPTACHHFMQCQGLELYMEVLESYHTESSIQQKVLGLLNNVAEVVELRPELMDEDLVEHVLSLLQGAEVEVGVSYFAGGILAHLCSTGGPPWSLDAELHQAVLDKLHSSILTWSPPEREMVSYRTFQPFYPLLQSSQPPGVQLWSVWAMRLVCSQSANQYGDMLEEEGGIAILQALVLDSSTHTDVRRLAEDILGLLEQRQHHGNQGEEVQ